MNSPLPAALLELKSSFDHWRSTRSHIREPIPDDLRHAAQEISRRYSRPLVARILQLDFYQYVSDSRFSFDCERFVSERRMKLRQVDHGLLRS